MKKQITAAFWMCVVGAQLAHAQISLQSQHFSAAGESFIFSTLNDPAIDYVSTGAGYNWDFSTLTPTGQRTTVNENMSNASQLSNLFFGPFAQSAYQATYFGTTTDVPLDQITSVLPVTIDGINLFTKRSSSAITSIGYEFIFSGTGIPAKSDTIETRYVLPLNYGDTYSSNGYTKLDMNPIYDGEWRQHRQRQSEVDGWGTITTPYGTFSALRIHHIINENDSVYLTVSGTGFWIPLPIPTAHEYEWRALEEKEPVMRIKTTEIAGQQGVTSIEYRDNYNGLGIDESSLTVAIGPNPVMDQLSIQSSSSISDLMVIDASGKIIKTLKLHANEIDWSLSELESGNYQLLIRCENGIQLKSFSKL